jgi:2-hydroxy-3-keto-5-methylthiopentenyl-1-phosphate phosphatase
LPGGPLSVTLLGVPSPIVSSLVVDFDGTICPRDVSEEILGAFAPPEWWEIDLEFQRGAIGSRECLIRQAELLVGRQEEMQRFAVERHPLEPSFAPFVEWASGTGTEVTVASDGFGFYVEPMLRAAGLEGLTVLTNDVILGGGAPRFAFPNGHPVCVGCGTCKMRAVIDRRPSGFVGFIGEGHSDRYGALYADVVFAKKHLVEICRRDGVPFVPWETFDDVRRSLEEDPDLPGSVSPAECPGWTLPC